MSDFRLRFEYYIAVVSCHTALLAFKGARLAGGKLTSTGTIRIRIANAKILEADNHFRFLGLFA